MPVPRVLARTTNQVMPRNVYAAVITSAYNNPESLRKCLLGLSVQTDPEFEIIVADDGSDGSIAEVLKEPRFQDLRLKHVWHADRGFRLRTIKNRAIAVAEAPLLIFLDSDCVPRSDFVASHRRCCRPHTFAAGARVDIPPAVHQQFTDDDILSNRVFDVNYLRRMDPALNRYRWRLKRRAWYERLANLLTWRYCVFAGSNGSAWRTDVVAVNGFDEAFSGYGSDDRDLGVRMHNGGVRSRYCKFSLITLHLDHPRPWVDPEKKAWNRRAFKQRFRDGTTRTSLGVDTVLQRD